MISHGEHGAGFPSAFDADVNGLAISILDGVRQKVREHLLDPKSVPQTIRRRAELHRSLTSRRFELSPMSFDDVAHELAEVHASLIDREPAGIDARDVEHVVNEACQAI